MPARGRSPRARPCAARGLHAKQTSHVRERKHEIDIAPRESRVGSITLLLMLGTSRCSGLVGSIALLAAVAGPAHAEGRFGPHDVRTLFVIGKNTDRNEVQYGIRLDKDCVPVGDEPIYPYWRQYEKGPEVTADLNWLDKTGYGIKDQRVEKRAPGSSKVVMRLRATSERLIAVLVRKEGAACAADPIAYIAATPAKLQRIHVQLSGPLSIDWIDIRGLRADNGQPINERAKP